VNEMTAGTKGEVAVKVYGDDYEKLAAIVGPDCDGFLRTSVRKRTSVTNRYRLSRCWKYCRGYRSLARTICRQRR